MLGKTDRTGKFGKIFLMISQGLGIVLLKAQLVKKNLQILNNSQKYLS